MRKLLLLIVFFGVLSLLHQSAFAQIPLVGYIKTTGPTDVYPTHIDSLQKGGYRIVKDYLERDAISTLRRKAGMLVYEQLSDSMYILKGGIANTDWAPYTPSTVTTNANLTGMVTSIGNATT